MANAVATAKQTAVLGVFGLFGDGQSFFMSLWPPF